MPPHPEIPREPFAQSAEPALGVANLAGQPHVSAVVAAGALNRPEFIRLCHPGQRCPYTGLSRSAVNALILPTAANDYKPPVKSFVLRKRGAKTGIRLIDYDSLVNYIRAHEDTGAPREKDAV